MNDAHDFSVDDLETRLLDYAALHTDSRTGRLIAAAAATIQRLTQDRDGWQAVANQQTQFKIDANRRIHVLEAEFAKAREALTPSAETEAAYTREFDVPWTTIKEIMKAISARAALAAKPEEPQP